MRKFYKKNKKLVGVIFLLLAIGFFIFWEFIGRNELLHKKVIVLNQDVFQGTEITNEMLDEVKIDVNDLVNGYVNDESCIVGLEAKHFIPARSQLILEYFDIKEFVLSEEQKIMKIPSQWLHSFPETLRRKDKVFLYAIKSNLEDINNQPSIISNAKLNNEIYVLSTIVAYVKDNANREVESLDASRLIGSSTISVVEVIITDKEFEMLEDYASQGYTFALLYQ